MTFSFKPTLFYLSLTSLLMTSAVDTAFATPKVNKFPAEDVFNLGTGIYDITGPAAEEGMMGYAMIMQQTDGILTGIERAQNNMTLGHIKIATGDLPGINFNRSPASYQLNPSQELIRYHGDTDTEMTLIRFENLAGKPIGLINWFPIHGVSM